VIDSKYPTLDLLERHGLRAAYVILMLGTCSWTHFQALHEAGIPEDCRLPRNLLMALKGEYRRLVESPRSTVLSTSDLLDEFNRARGNNTFGVLYWQRFVNSLNLPKEETPDDDEMFGPRWQLGAPTRKLHTYEGKTFRGTWRGLDVQVTAYLACSEGDVTDEEYRSLEAARGFQTLWVHIVHSSPLTKAQMEAVASVPRHEAFLRVSRHRTGITFYHELPSEGIGKHLVAQDSRSTEADLSHAGLAQLTEIVARIGVTDFRAE